MFTFCNIVLYWVQYDFIMGLLVVLLKIQSLLYLPDALISAVIHRLFVVLFTTLCIGNQV